MGKERDALIRSLGGVPISDLNLSNAEILKMARDTYWKRGEVPPDIKRILEDDLIHLNRKPDEEDSR